MPPKKAKKGGGKAKSEPQGEPEHDVAWEKAVHTGIWERPVTHLPGALRDAPPSSHGRSSP
jgi:hypothetical protein